MNVEKLTMDKDEARKLYQQYQQHRGRMTADDQAIAAIYKRIAQGKLVIRALASITAAGLNEQGYPKLAIARADLTRVQCFTLNGKVDFLEDAWPPRRKRRNASFAVVMPGMKSTVQNKSAAVPLIPVHLRPKASLQNYHILWEADWDRYPVDPYLLRRFGEDAWLVVAAWDLTPIERAVMSSRLNA